MNTEVFAWNVAAHWIQAGIVAASALIALRLLHVTGPHARLWALHLTLGAIVILPVLQPWRSDLVTPGETFTGATVEAGAAISRTAAAPIGAAPSVAVPLVVLAIVIAGVVLRVFWLLYGIANLARFGGHAAFVAPPDLAGELEAQLGVSPQYVQQIGDRGPWTFGLLRPKVALPAGFSALSPQFQRAVLCHELLHVRRRDIAVAFIEELAASALWFHPWIWLLRARIRVVREQAVDVQAVAMLGNRDDYVRCLVEMSGHNLAPHFSQAGAGMLRTRELRARVDAIFQEVSMSRERFAVAAVTFVGVTVATAMVAAAAMPLRAPQYAVPAFRPALAAPPQTVPDAPRQQINTVYPEYPQDALERGIKGTVIVDITVNAAGDVSTAAVASGPQELRASAFTAALALKYSKGTSTTAMKIAFEYTLTGTSWGVKIAEALAHGGTRFSMTRQMPRDGDSNITSGASGDPDSTGAYRIGGDVRPPKKIKDVPPDYPAIAQQARVQGVVILEARIDEQGFVTDLRTLRSIPLLDQAAIEAVKQWQYEPPTRNGVAVPVLMTVTVNFSLRELFQLEVLSPDGTSGQTELLSGGLLVLPGGRFELRMSRLRRSDDVTVSVFAEDRQTHLGDMTLTLNGPTVQSSTTPSFGLRLRGVR